MCEKSSRAPAQKIGEQTNKKCKKCQMCGKPVCQEHVRQVCVTCSVTLRNVIDSDFCLLLISIRSTDWEYVKGVFYLFFTGLYVCSSVSEYYKTLTESADHPYS